MGQEFVDTVGRMDTEQLAGHPISSPDSNEVWLQGIAHRLLLRVMHSNVLEGNLSLADSTGFLLDDPSQAFVDYLDAQIDASPSYPLLTMYQINKAAFYWTLRDGETSLAEFPASIKDCASSESES